MKRLSPTTYARMCDAIAHITEPQRQQIFVEYLAKYIIRHRDQHLLPNISRALTQLQQKRGERVDITVATASELSSADQKHIQQILMQHFGPIAHVHFTFNAAILGGIILRVNNLLHDYSFATSLEQLSRLTSSYDI